VSAFKPLAEAAIISLLAIVAAISQASIDYHKVSLSRGAKGSGDEVTYSEIQAWVAPPIWVDARSNEEFGEAHIPSAISLNEANMNRNLPALFEIWQEFQPIVVYCAEEECNSSRRIAEHLREGGLSPVFVLKGGWQAYGAVVKQ